MKTKGGPLETKGALLKNQTKHVSRIVHDTWSYVENKQG